LLAASRQFPEGDVQHWWHPPSGKGVRTHISDDLVWLPFTVAHYIDVTGDAAVLNADVPFIDGPPLAPEQHDAYFEPQVSAQTASLFEHCARALDCRLEVGRHGLPLIGTGDWNDGMNRVGHRGEGESVWMAWFLHATLTRFAPIAERQGERARAQRWRAHAEKLRLAAERDGWDGDWYRRAYFDDGTPLGTAPAAECRIDSLSQSWAVLSGAADVTRASRAMAAVDEYLVRHADNIVLLLTPPFDRTPLDPGYIKGYLPGIRENGGQYTHAAVWTVMAHAALGDGNRAGELFNLLNPINHAKTRLGVQRYKVEPYVLAGDVYGEVPHVGRGGWTWYSGSAGWMYRAGIEAILGFRLSGRTLRVDPCIPQSWPGFKMTMRYHSARYEILVENPHGVCRGVESTTLDGDAVDAAAGVTLIDDGAEHVIQVILGAEQAQTAE
jgi:cyclic beta-1,2-glucan glucanotransferase